MADRMIRTPVTFVRGTNGGEALTKYWAAVLVKINTEQSVSAKLSKLGIVNFVPSQIEIRQWSDRRKKVQRIVIPMIVFVYVDKQLENQLRRLSFIYKFLSYPGQTETAKIPEDQISILKFMISNSDEKVEISEGIYKPGDEVEIVRGPLKGFHGELYLVEDGKSKVGIYIDSLGYACVSIDRCDVVSRNKLNTI